MQDILFFFSSVRFVKQQKTGPSRRTLTVTMSLFPVQKQCTNLPEKTHCIQNVHRHHSVMCGVFLFIMNWPAQNPNLNIIKAVRNNLNGNKRWLAGTAGTNQEKQDMGD